MKIIAAIQADLETTPLGGRSRLLHEIAGRTILDRTLHRTQRIEGISGIHLLVPQRQRAAFSDLLAGRDISLHGVADAAPPYHAITAAGRIWGLDGWRGGIGGLCWFDEDIRTAELAAIARGVEAAAVLCIPAHAALVSPELSARLIEHYRERGHPMRLSFTPAPPGLAPVIFATDLLEELAGAGQPPGALLTYHPSRPTPDLAGRECCYRPAAHFSETRGRMLADTRRGLMRIEMAVGDGADDSTAEQLAHYWRGFEAQADPLGPEEIEIELTTDDPLRATTRLRPRLREGLQRGPIDLKLVERISDETSGMDDLRIVLGGFGEPLLHPHVVPIVEKLRRDGAAAIAIRTNGLAGDEATDRRLFDIPVDVLIVTLDATTAGQYVRAHGNDAFGRAMARVERWMQWREERRQVRPLIVPELMKTTLTFDEMEAFFDQWIERLGCASITAPSHAAGQCEDLAVTRIAPPRRLPCRRLGSRVMVLADGTVTACDQDVRGCSPMGSLSRAGLREVWMGDALQRLRSDHQRGEIGAHPLCAACDEWHRP